MNFKILFSSTRTGLLGALVGSATLLSMGRAFAATFTPGNLVVFRVGTGAAALSSSATAVFLDEYSPSGGAAVQSIALPTAASGGNFTLTDSGNATSDGGISRSTDGRYIVLTGYNAPVGTTTVASSSSTTNPRVIGRVAADGSVDTTTTTTSFNANNIRSAASVDGTSFYAVGGANGVILLPLGGSGAGTAISTTSANNRQVNIFGGQLYTSSGTNTFKGVDKVGTGTPTTSGQTTTRLPGLTDASNANNYSFFFADLSPTVPGVDTLYVADNTSGIQKFTTSDGTTYTAAGAVAAAGITGITGVLTGSGSGVTLYVTSPTAISKLTDTSGYGANITGTVTSVVTAPTNTAFRGIAPAPVSTANATSGALISQFRLGGPGGATDEFIELANTTASAISLRDWSLVGTGAAVPLAGTIPAGGHLLLTNSGGYSLGTIAAGDVTYTGDIPTSSPLILNNAAGTPVDTVSNLSAIAAPTSGTDQYAYLRRLETGAPAKTGTDTNDFNLVDTAVMQSTVGATGVGPLTAPRLGSPNPHSTASTVQRNAQISNSQINIAAVPTAARYASKNSAIDTAGRLSIRRTIKNNTGAAVSKLRFRITAITGGTSGTAGVADLRAISSGGVKYFNNSVLTQAAIGMPIDAPTTPIEAPLTSGSTGSGGGLNAGWTVPLPGGTLAAGSTVNVEFLFGIKAEGKYRIVVDAELLP